jgi:hypothetical protein
MCHDVNTSRERFFHDTTNVQGDPLFQVRGRGCAGNYSTATASYTEAEGRLGTTTEQFHYAIQWEALMLPSC